MADDFVALLPSLESPGYAHYAVTPSDSVDFTHSFRGLYVGGTGDVVIVDNFGTAVTWKAVPVGTIIRMRGKRVNSTSTTATNIVAYY